MPPERRTTSRISRLVPLVLHRGNRSVNAVTSVINAQGALILSPEAFNQGADLVVVNQRTRVKATAWVVWTGPAEEPGLFKLGIQFLEPSPHFWGADYQQ